jgi:hypothetical protein
MFETWTVDQLERTLIEAEQRIGQLRAMQMALLDRLDGAQVARLDGSRDLAEWVAARADVGHPTARTLVRTARTTADRPELRIPLAEGHASFARCAATARLAATGASPDVIHRSAGCDIAGVHRLASRHRTFTRLDEREVFERRHLVMQSSLDDAMGRIYGEFAGYEWRLIEKAITERADTFPADPAGERATATQRRADALAAICGDAIDGHIGSGTPPVGPLLTVFVDTRTRTNDPALIDATLEGGPRVGSTTVERMLCDGAIEAIGIHEDGTPLALGRITRAIPPKLRRFILHRDGGCTVDGCGSRYRLQVHHIRSWADGGRTDPDNLTTLCWYHHHVVVHGRGFRIDPSSPPQRRRFLRPLADRAPPTMVA